MTPPVRALGALADFRCTGPACPASCCAGWELPVDEDTVARWRAGGLDTARAAVEHGPRGPRISRDAAGQCALLAEGWCTLQQDHGEAALPWACATFPRVSRAWPDAVDTTLTLACPEAARLVVGSDAAVAWVHWPVERLPRSQGERPARGLDRERLLRGRGTQLLAASLLADGRVPLHVRLFQVAVLAVEVVGAGPVAPAAWRAALSAPGWGAAQHRRLLVLAPRPEDALRWLGGALDPWLGAGASAPLRDLAARTLRGRPLATLAGELARRRAEGGPGPDPAFARHARHHVLHHPATRDADPAAWAQRLLLHTAAVRVLAWLHPDAPSPGASSEAWTPVVADVAFRVARDVEHATRADVDASPWRDAGSLRTLGAVALLTAV